MNSANNLGELKSGFFPSLTSRWVYDLVNILMTASSDPRQRAQLGCGQILDPQKLLDNKWVLFKLLSLLSLVMQQQMTNTRGFFFFFITRCSCFVIHLILRIDVWVYFFKFPPFSWTTSDSSSITFCLFFFFHAADSVSVDLWVSNCFKSEKLTMFEFPLLLVKIFYIRFSLINMNYA